MTRLVAVLVATCVLAAACGGSDDGDVEVYCQLVNNGVGTVDGAFESLLEVAPPEIRDAVNELANTTREFEDIEEIDELFDAAFDPDAQAARLAFSTHATESCGYEPPADDEEALRFSSNGIQLREYVSENFGNDDWPDKVTYRVAEASDGQIYEVTARFVDDPEDDEALDACAALGVWLYVALGAAGEVRIEHEGEVVAQRLTQTATCEAPDA
ncbi:MAG: hypothetical protein AAF480_13055 [Actinomycetota bacterium]